MTPDERQLLSGLFDRIRNAPDAARDMEAQTFISDAVRQIPSAPYVLAQTVLVQEQALGAANQRLQELEAQVRDLQAHASQPQQGGGSFLGGLGSLFGGSQPPRPQAPANPPQYAPPPQQSPWGQQPQQSPWGAQPQQSPWGQAAAPPSQGPSFLSGALTTAAGVAGGMLAAESISSLFSSHRNPGLADIAGNNPLGGGGNETIINNFYDKPGDSRQSALDTQQGNSNDQDQDFQDSSDDYDDSGSGGDDSSNV
ncbi:DUF2076 domain-containing protein [Methylovirgula sp. 4M-Z18]|uniref:DUF2076 domain-containing protein n=1 Tax=Methylovirgula sp. 4M-Z18 TaxID=2293567 RepID=UPI000E2F0D35|nr:DUF2076 domain-containing protein [Methylovirgula sp. 4M-Z18]RFB79693.1 DUF2076 domain-containing protein [Methylovirgula sp. 4M-Z18]